MQTGKLHAGNKMTKKYMSGYELCQLNNEKKTEVEVRK